MNILNCLFRHFDEEGLALISEKREMTYKSLCNNAIGFSRSLDDSSDVAVLYMTNSIEYVVAYFATLLSGKKALLVNPMYPASEVEKYLDMVNSRLLITNIVNDELKEKYKVICPIISEVSGYSKPEIPNKADEGAVIIPTSGTTGEAKLIMLTHRNIVTNVLDILDAYDEIREEDVEMIILPMTSIFCHTAQMLVPLHRGMKLDIWTGGFNIPGIINEIKERNVSYCQMVPAILRMFVYFYKKLDVKLPSLRRSTIGGEPISVEELSRLAEAIAPIRIQQGYGMTETSPVICSQRYVDSVKFGSSGKLMKSIEIRIDPLEEGGKEGLIFVKGPSVCKTTYDGKAIVGEDGWLNTGDIGYLDENNELYICGRQKNLIVVGGMNVYPEEVEGVMKGYKGVGDVLVYGEKSELKGEIVKAKITTREIVDTYKLQKYCATQLPMYKVPEAIEIVQELDKTFSSKIKRF